MDDSIRAAICRIDIMKDGACLSRGTGTLVAKGVVLTAFHVVGDRRSSPPAPYPGDIVVTFPSGATSGTLFVPHCDQRTDWALVQVAAALDIRPVPFAPACESGASWESFGWPDTNARDGMTHTGTITYDRAELDSCRVLQLFCNEAAAGAGEKVRGLSGAPVLVKNAIAGVMRFSLMTDGRTEAGTLYGVPADVIISRCCNEDSALLPMPDPCYGLPGLPANPLPADPFRYLARFTEEDAEIFFGRQKEIRLLFDMATADDGTRLILLYGQSGIGKSSFLDAGLTPRLRWFHETRYVRRNATHSLLETLIATVTGASGTDAISLAGAWERAEHAAGKPLIVIFDQIEEVFTQPNKREPEELQQFVSEIGRAFCRSANTLRGKLILSFRKEWFPEVQKLVESAGVENRKLFLEAMGRDAVMECVNGLTSTARLRKKYGLRVEEALPLSIANDLTADTGSPVAPMLQILLTQMWANATKANSDQPEFSIQLYLDLKQRGMLLGDFLDRQLEELRQSRPEDVSSGLALDLLEYHTTSTMSVRLRTRQEILAAYGKDREPALWQLLTRCTELALLVDGGGSGTTEDQCSRLSHDTLAPSVSARYAVSVLPGPRARRVLEGRSAEWNEVDEVPLEGWELRIVDEGKAGTRAFTEKEQRLIAAARAHLDQQARRRRRYTIALLAIPVLILAGAIVTDVMRRRAVAQRDLAELYHEYSDTLDELDSDPFLALAKSVAVARRSLASQKRVLSELQNVLGKTVDEARETYLIQGDSPVQAISANGENVVDALADGTLRLHRTRDAQPRNVTANSTKSGIKAISFTPDGGWFVTVDDAGFMKLWNRTGDWKRDLITPSAPGPGQQRDRILSLAVTPDSAYVVSGWSNAAVRVVPIFESPETKQEIVNIPDLGTGGIRALAAMRLANGETVLGAAN